jgi:phytol kinase
MQLFIFLGNLFLAYSFIPPILVNPLISSSQLIIGKKSKELLESAEINANFTRKIIHISTAPTFISTWNFYNNFNPKLWATLVPIFTSLFLIYKGDKLTTIISRSGDSKEILKGPLIYTLVLSYLTYTYWLNNPIGIIAMTQLSIGDGFADIIGRNFGKTKWPHSNKKSVEGTLGYFLTSLIGTQILVNNYYNYDYDFNKIIIISLISSLVETFSEVDDNISIPLSVLFLDYLF